MTSISSVTGNSTVSTNSTKASGAELATSQDRFLKLLVAQLNNQDPMNPMDNAQMTSQIAQINTVTGIQQVNDTLKGMTMLQSASMVGRDVLIDGNSLAVNSGKAAGAFDLPANAASVKVNILSSSRQVVGTLDLGARDAGRQLFDWDASSYKGSGPLTFEVAANNGGANMSATPLTRHKVLAVGSENGSMSIQLQNNRTIAYSAVKAIL